MNPPPPDSPTHQSIRGYHQGSTPRAPHVWVLATKLASIGRLDHAYLPYHPDSAWTGGHVRPPCIFWTHAGGLGMPAHPEKVGLVNIMA
jgi:hypothetical protein